MIVYNRTSNKKTDRLIVSVLTGAGEGDRTLVFGLGSRHSAIELHPRGMELEMGLEPTTYGLRDRCSTI